MTTSIIGSGNLAWHLAPALDNIGYAVCEVYARDIRNAKNLVKILYNATAVDSLDFSESEARLFILAVSDDAIEKICQEIILPENSVVVHTSGSVNIEILSFSACPSYGVLYPLQSFSKGRRVNIKEVPLFIEANNDETCQVIRDMASQLSDQVKMVDSKSRRELHLAAVFANNFTNHMLRISSDIAESHNLSFQLLHPLIAETINKMLEAGPENAQTGPARRHDYHTLDEHLALLSDNDELSEIYRLISQHIADTYAEQNEE